MSKGRKTFSWLIPPQRRKERRSTSWRKNSSECKKNPRTKILNRNHKLSVSTNKSMISEWETRSSTMNSSMSSNRWRINRLEEGSRLVTSQVLITLKCRTIIHLLRSLIDTPSVATRAVSNCNSNNLYNSNNYRVNNNQKVSWKTNQLKNIRQVAPHLPYNVLQVARSWMLQIKIKKITIIAILISENKLVISNHLKMSKKKTINLTSMLSLKRRKVIILRAPIRVPTGSSHQM